MYWLLDPAVIFFGLAISSLAAVLLLSFGAGVRYQIGFDRLPAAARLGELEVLIGGREARLQEVTQRLQQAEAALAEREKAELEAEYWRTAAETTKAEYDALSDLRREIDEAKEDYRRALEDLTIAESELRKQSAAADEAKARADAAEARLKDIDSKEKELMGRIERLREELSGLDGSGTAQQADDRALADLTKPPACLAREMSDGKFEIVLPDQMAVEAEADALRRVMKHLKQGGLEFKERTVYAFHTCLKTAVISPLTVLAGISGTGKSQLPRYYADAMGMHFLKIPVQPRWDGPQDLFGFYNYIERKYKATDLARALVHLDPHNWNDIADKYKDRMLIVLLDEMNLARVEYYFSEFLSRLEGRPFDESSMTANDRRPSEIDIDVSQAGQGKRVYVGQNVLFVGTMNEDESTLALSDKVLDRANVLRFPKPENLEGALPRSDSSFVAQGYLPRSRWTGKWIRPAAMLDDAQRKRASDVVAKINDVMNELGRPFGHRMGQAMLHYVANYPATGGRTNNMDQVNFALGDQIEQRILPRLRGVVAEEHNRALHNLAGIADTDLQDGELAEEINQAVQRSTDSNGLFVWRGFTRRR